MDAKFRMFRFWAFLLLIQLQMAVGSNTTTPTNSPKDRRWTDLDYPILPPPTASRNPGPIDFQRFSQSGLEKLKPAPTIKSIGLDSQPPKMTTPTVRYSNSVPKLLLDEQDFSIYAPPKATLQLPPKETFQQPSRDTFQPPPKDAYQPPPGDTYQPPKDTFQLSKDTFQPPKDAYQPPPGDTYQPPPKDTYQPPPKDTYQPSKDTFQPPPKDTYQHPSKDTFQHPPKDIYQFPPKDPNQSPPKELFQEDFHHVFTSTELPAPSQDLKSRDSHHLPGHPEDSQFLHPLSYLYSGAKEPTQKPPNFITTTLHTPTTTIPVFIPISSSTPAPPPRHQDPRPSDNDHHPENVVQDSRQDYQHAIPRMVSIVAVDVECSMTSMLVHLKFDGPFGGVVYSKGYFNDKLCHYVPFGSGQREYEFVIAINRCGAQFADFTPGGQASLEDIIVVQNEQGIQEIWDTARRIQCTWAGIVEKKVNSAFHVDTLETVAVKYNADTANAYMDIQLGKGPFASPVTGLVKIGDTITVVIAIESPGDVDVRVKECIAHNGDNRPTEEDLRYGRSTNIVRLTDEDGCVLKPKLLSPWRKTRETGDTGANILTYSYLQAFKFPDRMEVYLECTLEICKKQCHSGCHEADPGYPRQKRGLASDGPEKGNQTKEQFVLQRTLRVISPEELNHLRNGTKRSRTADGQPQEICLTVPHFVIAIVVIFLVVIASCVATAVISLRKGFRNELRSTILKKTSYAEAVSKNP